jgi:hypothetical protein
MDDRDCLAHYPFVVVRIACRVCSRRGSYRLARLAAKFGPEISLRDLTDRFSYDCLWRAEARSKRGKSACGVSAWSVMPLRLTAAGHQFVEALSNKEVWATIKHSFKDASISTLRDVSIMLLEGYAQQKIKKLLE